jgi:outer membrane protein
VKYYYKEKTYCQMTMKRSSIMLATCLFFFVIAQTLALAEETLAVPEQWTTENAVRFALENNPNTAITKQRIAAAQAAVQEANSAFYPRLDLNASYQQTNNPMYSFGNILNQGEFDDTIDFNNPGTTDNLGLNATISYKLYNGGRDQAGIDAAEANQNASLYEMDIVRSQLSFMVVKTLFTIVQAEETLQARQSALDSIDASLQVAKARHEAGDLLKTDLLNLEVHQFEARENMIQTKHAVNLTKRSFLNLLGLEQGSVIIAPNCVTEQLVPNDLSYKQRPELQKLTASLEAAEANLRQANSGYYPTADAFAGYQVNQGFELDGSGNSWLAGIKINYNLFSGKQTEAQVATAKARLAEQKQHQRKLTLAINLEVEKAKLAVEQAQQRLQVTEKMVELAEENANLHRERFKEGLLLSSELIDVENRLTDAKVRRTLARAAKRIAIADLRRAIGLGQFETASQTDSSIDNR